MGAHTPYRPEQEAFLQEHHASMSRQELTDAFNARFGTSKSMLAIKSWCNRRGLNSTIDGRFQKGNVSWQTGKTGEEYWSHFTPETKQKSLRQMTDANRKYRIGDTVIRHGRAYIYMDDRDNIPLEKRLYPKSRHVWERAHGPVPSSHRVVHLNRDPLDCRLENLYCIPDRFVTTMNKNHWFSWNPEITLAGIRYCELLYAARDYTEASERKE